MKSIIEIAEICNVSKTTVRNAMHEIGIEPYAYKNKFVFDESDAEKIAKYICPDKDFSNTFQNRAETKTETENSENQTENFENQTEKQEQKQEKIETFDNNGSNNEKIINILSAQLEAKDKQINSLLEQVSLLTQTNAFLTKQIEDKSKSDVVESEKVIFNEVPVETQVKRKWWQFWK